MPLFQRNTEQHQRAIELGVAAARTRFAKVVNVNPGSEVKRLGPAAAGPRSAL
jgi:hypothetical protein